MGVKNGGQYLGQKQYLNSKIGRIRGKFCLETSRAFTKSLALVFLLDFTVVNVWFAVVKRVQFSSKHL